MIGTFSLVHFYHVIVKTLSNSTLPWVIETMEWWQQYVFPHPLSTCQMLVYLQEDVWGWRWGFHQVIKILPNHCKYLLQVYNPTHPAATR